MPEVRLAKTRASYPERWWEDARRQSVRPVRVGGLLIVSAGDGFVYHPPALAGHSVPIESDQDAEGYGGGV